VLAFFGWLFVALTLGALNYSVLPGIRNLSLQQELMRQGVAYQVVVTEPVDDVINGEPKLYFSGGNDQGALNHWAGEERRLSHPADAEFIRAHPPGSKVWIRQLADNPRIFILDEYLPRQLASSRRMIALASVLAVFCIAMALLAFWRADRAARVEKLK